MSSVLVSVTVASMDAGVKPTGMYSRRVAETITELMSIAALFIPEQFLSNH